MVLPGSLKPIAYLLLGSRSGAARRASAVRQLL